MTHAKTIKKHSTQHKGHLSIITVTTRCVDAECHISGMLRVIMLNHCYAKWDCVKCCGTLYKLVLNVTREQTTFSTFFDITDKMSF